MRSRTCEATVCNVEHEPRLLHLLLASPIGPQLVSRRPRSELPVPFHVFGYGKWGRAHASGGSSLPGSRTTLCTVLAPGIAAHPGPGTRLPRLHLPIPSGTRVAGPSTHYLSCPNPLSPPPASPSVPVHPTASPPPSLLASTLWLWEGVGDRKGGCHPHPLTPEEGTPKF